ncbi:MAG: ATP-dependent DNA helicase [Acidobacteriota bacterium]
MKEIFGKDGLIARFHPDFEFRPGQLAMAEAVSNALAAKRHLLVEAGTGIGKTLAYLVPAVATGRRIIISTGTKNLQEQLFFKDIPFLQSILPRKFRATYLKGRSNYVCLNRLKRAETSPILSGMDEADYFEEVRQWAYTSDTGDRAELTRLPESLSFWRNIDARSDICLGSKCPSFDPCFITRARQASLESEIVIVNHHLFFADLALRGRDWGQVLPDYSAVIFDEAHQIEDIAAQYFGASVSSFQLVDVIADITRLPLTDVDATRDLNASSARVMRLAEHFWVSFLNSDSGERAGSAEGRFTLRQQMFFRKLPSGERQPTTAGERFLGLKAALDRLMGTLATIKQPPPELEAMVRRVDQVKFDLEFIVRGDEEKFVYWGERRARGVFLTATPIDAAGMLNDRLFAATETVILTSATLASAGSFKFMRSRLGIDRADELIAESNFDYSTQSILYLPARMPDPRSAEFTQAAAIEIEKLLRASHGRAFVLSTSYAHMQALRNLVGPRIDFPIFMQGEGSRSGLLDRFRETPGAVLFGTSSFWQGVDVRGEALSCVIIDKLPFAVPSDPVVAARQLLIDKHGGSSFNEYSVPSAIIALKQGIGRLIRSASDRGVLSILDPRILTKSYGQAFLNSLHRSPVTHKISDVERFFADPKTSDAMEYELLEEDESPWLT